MRVRKLIAVFVGIAIAALVLAKQSKAHFKPGTHNAVHAIQQVWCGRANRECWQGWQAIRVAICESGPYWTWGIPARASNGQYQGMMQMGSSERARFGHGPDPWSQARAAKRYHDLSGWGPWECARILGIR